jgi:hypothetical protein
MADTVQKSSSSFHVVHIYLFAVSNGVAIFKTENTFPGRGDRCNDIRPHARSTGVEQIHFVSDMKVRFL